MQTRKFDESGHYQARNHEKVTKEYGKEDGENANRKVARPEEVYEGGLDDRIAGAYQQEIRGY